MRFAASVLSTTLIAGGAGANDLVVTMEIPRLSVAEYHNPYVAIWLAGPT